MRFGVAFGLLVGLLVALPYLAHRLRRKKSERVLFAPTEWVDPVVPKARRRAQLEDKALLALRAVGVLLLALLASVPLVRCNRVALAHGGASIALVVVVDDSMSMRGAPSPPFARAKVAATELLASLQEGDAVAIVLAGSPVRVALPPTATFAEAKRILETLPETDRATDLEGALKTAESLIQKQPQVDKRIVLLSDLVDGANTKEPLTSEFPLWAPLGATRLGPDCAVIEATRSDAKVKVNVACNDAAALQGRKLEIRAGKDVLGTSLGQPLRPRQGTALFEFDDLVALAGDVDPSRTDLAAVLTGTDAVASDDTAPVQGAGGPSSLLIVGTAAEEGQTTTGAALTERALRALNVPSGIASLPAIPDSVEDLAQYLAVIVDDAPGFTPEQRKTLGAFVERGGVALLALGPNAGHPPLGATFEPFIRKPVEWRTRNIPSGIDLEQAGFLGESAKSALDLDPQGYAAFEMGNENVLRFQGGAPLLARMRHGQGEVWSLGLPLSPGVSDWPLRPAFLAMLDSFVHEALSRRVVVRGEVGTLWSLRNARSSVAEPSGTKTELENERYVPSTIGRYQITSGQNAESRIAKPVLRELEREPRTVQETEHASKEASSRPNIDISRWIALVLLGLFFCELLMRALMETGKFSSDSR